MISHTFFHVLVVFMYNIHFCRNPVYTTTLVAEKLHLPRNDKNNSKNAKARSTLYNGIYISYTVSI